MHTHVNECKRTSERHVSNIIIMAIIRTAPLSAIDKSFSIDGGTCTRAADGRFVGAGVLFFSVKEDECLGREIFVHFLESERVFAVRVSRIDIRESVCAYACCDKVYRTVGSSCRTGWPNLKIGNETTCRYNSRTISRHTLSVLLK